MKIAMLGAGAFGTALGGILRENGQDVQYYDPKIENVDLEDVLAGASYNVVCAPSQVVPDLLPQLPLEVPLIIATKGLMTDAGLEGFYDWMVLSGPGFADDIKAHRQTLLTATSPQVVELFETDYLKFDLTRDRLGVLMCGALKNVYAIEAGLEQLVKATPAWRDYIAAATRELREILATNGAEVRTVDLACGVGDLELTAALPSRNYEFGLKLHDDATYRPEKTVEGVTALMKLRQGELKVPETAEILRKLLKTSTEWV